MQAPAEADRQLVYFADPMCSWCWGFSPVIRRIKQVFGERVPIHMVLGGLSPDITEALDAEGRETLRQHWQHVNELSGARFNMAFFEREHFVYNTEPASRAVVTANKMGTGRSFVFLAHLQQAFYTANRDITDRTILVEEAVSFGLDRDEFERHFDDPQTRQATYNNFALARRSGVSGFPSLLALNSNSQFMLTQGFVDWDDARSLIEAWLAQ